MKRFIDWLKSASQQQSAGNKTEDEHGDDSSFSWTDIDQADSSIFDTGSLVIEKSEDRNAVSQKMLSPQGGSSRSVEEGIGVDPYNTGSFDARNK